MRNICLRVIIGLIIFSFYLWPLAGLLAGDQHQPVPLPSTSFPAGAQITDSRPQPDNSEQAFVPGRLIVKLKDKAVFSSLKELNRRCKVTGSEPLYPQVPSAKERLEELKKERAGLNAKEHSKWNWQTDKDSAEYKEYMSRVNAQGLSLDEQIANLEKLVAHLQSRQARAPAGVAAPNLKNTYILKFAESANIQSLAYTYGMHPAVSYAEPDYLVKLTDFPDTLPNDTYVDPAPQKNTWSTDAWGQDYPDLWGAKKIKADEAWKVAQGQTSEGRSIIVAVIDTGVDYSHEELVGKIWQNSAEIPDNGIDDDNNGYIDDERGWNFVNNDNSPMDDHSHGTHCAGTIAAAGNNAKGIIGIAPKSAIMPLKFLNAFGSGTTSNSVRALYYAVNNGADVTSNSYGGRLSSKTRSDAFDYASSQGVACIVAAGNSSENVDYFSPANINSVISVAATEENDRITEFSNFGRGIEVCAPGDSILSSVISGSTYTKPVISVDTDNGRHVETNFLAGSRTTLPVSATLLQVGNNGLGYPEDFDGQDFFGKIALIKRGEISFYEKAQNAINAGAVGVMIYNNVSGRYGGTLQYEMELHAFSISQEKGLYLKSLVESGPVIISISGVDFHGYSIYRGTSMACPHVAGVAALILAQYPQDSLTNNLVRLIQGCDEIDSLNPGFEGKLGRGRINAQRSLVLSQSELKPDLQVMTHYANSYPVPGKDTVLSLALNNNGITARDVVARLACNSNYVSIASGEVSLGDIDFKVPKKPEFSFRLAQNTPIGEPLDFVVRIESTNAPPIEYALQLKAQKFNLECIRKIANTTQQRPQAIADLDGDGKKEIIFVAQELRGFSEDGELTNRSMIYAIRPDGTDLPGWPVDTGLDDTYEAILAVAVGDIDDAGEQKHPEVVAYGLSGQLQVYDYLGAPLAGFPRPLVLGDIPDLFEGLALADIDKDGCKDIIVRYYAVGMDDRQLELGAYVNVLNYRGEPLPHWPFYDWNMEYGSSLAVGDTNRDGEQEIYVGYSSSAWPNGGQIMALDSQAVLLGNGPVGSRDYDFEHGPITLSDVDDPNAAKVMAVSTERTNTLYTFDSAGRVLSSGNIENNNSEPFRSLEVACADLDRNGQLEQVVSDNFGTIHVFGNASGNWPAKPLYEGMTNVWLCAKSVVGDIDGDNYPEVLNWTISQQDWVAVGMDNSYAWLNAWNHDATAVEGFPLRYTSQYVGQFGANLAIDDLDGDGKVEIVSVGTSWVNQDSGVEGPQTIVSVLRLDAPYEESRMDWPMFRHDAARTGMYSKDSGSANHAPVLSDIGNQAIAEGAVKDITLSATDQDGNNLTFSASNLPAFASLTDHGNGSATLHLTPSYTDSGTHENITFSVSDGSLSDTETITITVNNVDRPPVLDLIGNKTIDEAAALSFSILATDPDGEEITYSMAGLPSEATLNSTTGVFSWTPTYNQSGSYNVTFTATAASLSDTETISITVNNVDRPPVLDLIGNKTIDEAAALSFSILATDPDGEEITYTAENLPQGATFDANTRTFSWTPDYTQAGEYPNITFTATANSLSDSETISISVNNVNRPPLLDDISDITIEELKVCEITLNATDPDGGALSFSATNLPAFAVFTDNGNGTALLHLAPQAGTAATYPNIHFTVTDGSLTDEEVITITVQPAPHNHAPELTPIGNQSVAEGEVRDINISATDIDGDNLTFSASSLPSFAQLTDNANGTATLRLNPGYAAAGTYGNIEVRVTDNAPAALSDSETFTIEVTNVNRPPQLNPIADQSLNENETKSITITATDPDNDLLQFSLSGNPDFVSLRDNGNASATLTISPGAGTAGVYNNITIRVQDNQTPAQADSKTITITVNPAPIKDNSPIMTHFLMDSWYSRIGFKAIDRSPLRFASDSLRYFYRLIDKQTGNVVINWRQPRARTIIFLSELQVATPGVYIIEIVAKDSHNKTSQPVRAEIKLLAPLNGEPFIIQLVNYFSLKRLSWVGLDSDIPRRNNILRYAYQITQLSSGSIVMPWSAFGATTSLNIQDLNLSPGKYTLEVKAKDSTGKESGIVSMVFEK
jgi:subtilisin family serine protease